MSPHSDVDQVIARIVLLPDAHSFADVLEYLGDRKDEREDAAVVAELDGNRITSYCSVDLSQVGGPRYRSINVKPTEAVLDVVRPRIVTPDDTLSFQIIAHEQSGKALVIMQHGYIIGGHWLAYIDPATIPAPPDPAIEAARAAIVKAGHEGPTWDTDEFIRNFELVTFVAGFVVVRRRADGRKGTLQFVHAPRVYFNFVEVSE